MSSKKINSPIIGIFNDPKLKSNFIWGSKDKDTPTKKEETDKKNTSTPTTKKETDKKNTNTSTPKKSANSSDTKSQTTSKFKEFLNKNSNIFYNPDIDTLKANSTAQQKASDYIVKNGDNLWNIAKSVYGDGSQYTRIYEANKDKISNPNLIYPNQSFVIPPAVTGKVSTPSSKKTSTTNNTSSLTTTPYTAPQTKVQTTNPPATGNVIADAAQKYIGTPYVWGGESMDEGGMDCSGFVYNALKDAGYNVGRTTAQGYRNLGTVVSKSAMQPGDLIFYGKSGTATHIGIYIGNGQLIHSSGGSKNTKYNPGKGVNIANVDHRSDFIEARRY